MSMTMFERYSIKFYCAQINIRENALHQITPAQACLYSPKNDHPSSSISLLAAVNHACKQVRTDELVATC